MVCRTVIVTYSMKAHILCGRDVCWQHVPLSDCTWIEGVFVCVFIGLYVLEAKWVLVSGSVVERMEKFCGVNSNNVV